VKLEELMCPELWESEAICFFDGKDISITDRCCSASIDLRRVSVEDNTFITIDAWYDKVMVSSKRLLDMYNHMVKVDKEKPA